MADTPLKLFFCFIICFSCAICKAQSPQKKIDSLLKANEAYTKQDTGKISLLCKISQAYLADKVQNSALDYGQQALALAEKLDQKKFIASCLLNLGMVTAGEAPYTASINYLERARDVYKGLNSPKLYANTLYWLGRVYYKTGDFKKAVDYTLQGFEIIKPISQPAEQYRYILNLGNFYLYLNAIQSAMYYGFEALKIAEKTNDKHFLQASYNLLASLEFSQHNYKESIDYGKKALTIGQEIDDKYNEAIYLFNLGLYYVQLEDYDNALVYYRKCLQLAKIANNPIMELSSEAAVGTVYFHQKKYDEAIDIFNKTIPLFKKTGNQYMAAVTLNFLASANDAKGNYEVEEKALDEASDLFNKLGNAMGRRDVLESYASLYQMTHQYDKALSSYKAFIALRDSLTNIDLKGQLLKKELQYDFDKKESAYQLTQAVNAKNLAQQKALSLQQQQQLLVQKQKLVLSDKEKSLQRIKFLARQAELENDSKLEAASLQKKTLQAKLDKQVANAQIVKQDETIKAGNRYQRLLLSLVVVALFIAGLIFYNQYKTRQLNRVILTQKKDLENINAVKDRMFGIISHDMRAPINTLIAFNALLDYEKPTPEDIKSYAKEIKETLDRTAVLMENLLNWSSSQMQGYKPALGSQYLKQISDDAMNSVAGRAFQKNIILKNNIADDMRVFADKNMTELIMRNILSNAIKYTAQNGVIELMAEQHAGETTFTITDTGTGLSAEQVMRFNSDNYNYSRSSTPGTQAEKGSGLGLVLCKTFTNMMNGRMFVKSIYGEGASFMVTLPQSA